MSSWGKCRSCHPTNSIKARSKYNAPTPTSCLASLFLHPSPNGRGVAAFTPAVLVIVTIIIIRPHHSTSLMWPIATEGVVCSIGLSDMTMSPAKTAEPMPFGMWTRVGPRNHVLDGVQIPPCNVAILRANRGSLL